MSDISPRRSRQTRRRTRSRSRSPRMSFFIGSLDNERESGSTSTSSAAALRQERLPSPRAFHFDLDDLMSSFLSSPRPPPVSQRRLAEIPKVTVTTEHTSTNTQCSVCFDEFQVNTSDVVRKLPCNHLFHEKCIFPWLRINGTCPVCRASLNQNSDGDGAGAPEGAEAPSFGKF